MGSKAFINFLHKSHLICQKQKKASGFDISIGIMKLISLNATKSFASFVSVKINDILFKKLMPTLHPICGGWSLL